MYHLQEYNILHISLHTPSCRLLIFVATKLPEGKILCARGMHSFSPFIRIQPLTLQGLPAHLPSTNSANDDGWS